VSAILATALPTLLAVFLAVLPGASQVRLEQAADQVLVISGGSGTQAWQIRYDSPSGLVDRKPILEVAEGASAWFGHGLWLRRLDTSKGVVTGRWRMPFNITGLKAEGVKVRVDFEDRGGDRVFRETVVLDPAAPQIPERPLHHLLLLRYSFVEPNWVFRPRSGNFLAVTAAEAKTLLPRMEEAVRRDPFSPWFQVLLAHLQQAAGDPRFVETLRAAVNNPHTDYTELFRLSARLDETGQADLAREAFERGYRDFLSRGLDPRQFTILITRLALYPVSFDRIPAERRDEILLRLYRLSPASEGADVAMRWRIRQLEQEGQSESASAWRARLQQAHAMGLSFWVTEWTSLLDPLILLVASTVLAGLASLIILYLRYRPQKRLDQAAGQRAGFRFLCMEYWDRRDRLRFFLVVLAAWLSVGLLSQLVNGILRVASVPVSLYGGSFAGPRNVWFLEERLPATPQRDLHLALAYQQSGEREKAASIYRRLPQFAVSWNNLGVLLKEAGKEGEARGAFEEALRLDPSLSEAALNLGRPASDPWTTQYRTYFPGKPMIAPPGRRQSLDAFLGTTWAGLALGSLGGPYLYRPDASLGVELPLPVRLLPAVMTLLMALALALLFVIPVREVTVAPEPRHWIGEVFFPGLSPRWGYAGGVVLLGWIYLLIQFFLFWRLGTPNILASIAVPNVVRSYGVAGTGSDFLRLINPSWIWIYAAPVVLFVVNLRMVLSGRRR
jgi:tetratricopeptide (TPR) repeat protein